MSAPPEELGTATASAGRRCLPGVPGHPTAAPRYWLERSADGAKRLVAVGREESAVASFTGASSRSTAGSGSSADTTCRERRGAAVRPALADPVPLRAAHLRRLRRPARARHARPRPGAEGRRRGDQPRLRPAVHPRDGPLRPYAVQRPRRRDLGRLPGGLDQPGRRRRRPSGARSRTSTAPRRPGSCSTRWIRRPRSIPRPSTPTPATIRQKVAALDWAGLESDLGTLHQDLRRAAASTWRTRRSSWTRSRCCGPWPSTAPPWPTRWPCTGG